MDLIITIPPVVTKDLPISPRLLQARNTGGGGGGVTKISQGEQWTPVYHVRVSTAAESWYAYNAGEGILLQNTIVAGTQELSNQSSALWSGQTLLLWCPGNTCSGRHMLHDYRKMAMVAIARGISVYCGVRCGRGMPHVQTWQKFGFEVCNEIAGNLMQKNVLKKSATSRS